MIRVESYLMIDERFIPVADFTGRVPDPQYIEGAIELEVDGTKILGLEMFDYVDQLWDYISQGLVEITTQQSWSTFFPDQPTRLTFSTDRQRQRITIEATPSRGLVRASAPYDEFMAAMCDAGQRFLRKMIEVVPENRASDEQALNRLELVISTTNQH